GVAGLEVEFSDLRRRDVNVVGARQVVVVGRAQESITVRQDFQNTFGEDVAFLFALRLEDFEDQVLLAHAARAGEVQRARDFCEFGYVLFFEFCNGHWFTCEGSEMEAGFQNFKGNSGHYKAGERDCLVKQPAVVPQQNVRVRKEPLSSLSLQSGPALRSWFPGFGYSACETCALPSRQAGKAYNGS